ncbi:MAG: helix-turn-helix domain-containing protein [bacterium]|nr:helix-turn-helix domain-containing protein [bacterium]
MSKDTDEDAMIATRLGGLGLSEKESRVYLALLPHRDIGTSKIIRMTGLHGQFVYDSLAKLEEKGLARHVVQNGRKKFSANTPNRLLSLAEEKRLAANALAKELQSRYAGEREQDVEIFQGDSAFVAQQFELLKRQPNDTDIKVIASESDRYQATIEAEGSWEEYLSIMREKNIRVRYLGSEAQRQQLDLLEKTQPWTYRILAGHSTGLMDTDIWHDNITLNIFGDPILCITVTGKEIADGYREFFETLWNLSGK